MTTEIAFTLAILAVSLVLFVTEWLRMDLVALLVLGVVAVSGLVTPAEALAGFSNPAVVTVWAMFMLSAGLTVTGVADAIGRQVLGWVGESEVQMVIVIMMTTGVLSAFMNNIGVAALMLPVVMDISRRTGKPPSRLLMPLAFGSLLGGLTTLIGTPPNLLASEALRQRGLPDFELFDFTPVGGFAMVTGVLYVAFVGRKFLPSRDISREASAEDSVDLQQHYSLRERVVMMRIAADSTLTGRSLRESRLGRATGLSVVAVLRADRTIPAPSAGFLLEPGDRLVVEGRLERFEELRGWSELVIEAKDVGLERLVSEEIAIAELGIPPDSSLAGQTIGDVGFRKRFGVIVLAILRDSQVIQAELVRTALRPGDRMLVQGKRESLDALRRQSDFEEYEDVARADLQWRYGMHEHLFQVRVPEDSVLRFKSLAKSRLGDALGLGVLGIVRDSETRLLPEPDERLMGNDLLIVRGDPDDLEVFRGLQGLQIEDEPPPDLTALQSDQTGFVEAILSPRTSLAGKTLGDLDFRERYGLQVLAIMREGVAHRTGLGHLPLRFGDALLLFGRREKLGLMAKDRDFIMLGERVEEPIRRPRAIVAASIMAAVVVPVLAGWLPIAVAAVAGAALMILTRCLTMDEAYHAIEWRSIFLIAGMLPLGVAMQNTGAATYLAERVLDVVGPLGPWGVIVGLYLLTAAATMIIPTAALIVLMAPIVIRASTQMEISPQAVMMAVAIAASASFTSPISHPANVLVMGPGGYKFSDYIKVGVPLTLVILVVALAVLPFFWPLNP